MTGAAYETVFDAEVWEYPGKAAWHFISLPPADADAIEDLVQGRPRAGFGSVRVDVRIGTSTWTTSVFPDRQRGTYILPVKRAVRDAEGLVDGTSARVDLRVTLDD